MEEIKADLKHLQADVRDIKCVLKDNTHHLYQYNAQLEIHIQATKDLQTRVKPIEDHVMFIRKLMQLGTWLFGLTAATAAVLKLLL